MAKKPQSKTPIDALGADEQAQLELLQSAKIARRGATLTVSISGKTWKVRSTSMWQNQKMSDMDLDVMYWQRQLKDETDVKRAKRLNSKIRKAYAKKAAHKVLGRRLVLLPLLYGYMWRKIYHASEAVSATINSTEALGENKVFYLANLGSSKQALVLSMRQVGDSVKQLTQRMESAESMVEADGLPTKGESK